MPYRKSNPWGKTKPPMGSVVDWGDPINNGLLSCWLFDGGGNSTSSRANDVCGRNPITIFTGGAWSVARFGKAVLLTGVTGLRAPRSGSLDFTGPGFTIAGWVLANTGTPSNTTIGGKWDGNGYMLYITGGGFRVYANGTSISSAATPLTNLGVWYFVAGTWDGSSQTAAIYINGVLDTKASLAVSALTAAAVPYEMGNYNNNNGSSFSGMLDVQRLYTRALSQAEVIRLYSEPFAGIVAPRRRIISQIPSGVTIALTGTVIGADADDIQAGGKTIILTITGDTWVASGGTFDGQRQNIINGLTSAQNELLGWNNVVKALQGVGGVVRTSDTVVTITLDAQLTYLSTASETVTATVPGSALTLGNQIVATPSFVIGAEDIVPLYQLINGMGPQMYGMRT